MEERLKITKVAWMQYIDLSRVYDDVLGDTLRFVLEGAIRAAEGKKVHQFVGGSITVDRCKWDMRMKLELEFSDEEG